jgi:hypothetical protein
VLHTPVTSAPSDLAICTANVPTPPEAPLMRTFCPGRTLPLSRSPCSAVMAATGTAAACPKLRFDGFGTSARSSRTATYSAKAPHREPNTSSPGRKRVTLRPTAATVPAKSTPSWSEVGRPRPESKRTRYGVPVR